MEDNVKKEYAEWIRGIRKACKLSQEKFAEELCHYRMKDGLEQCVTFHRNSVINWEKQKNLPIEPETIVGLAMMDYLSQTNQYHEKSKKQQLDMAERQKRYNHVQKCMAKYWGQRLYSRNINDALLIMAVVGVYSLEELPEVRESVQKIIAESGCVSQEEKVRLAQEEATAAIMEDLLSDVWTEEDFRIYVRNQAQYYAIGNRTFGERLVRIYKESVLYKSANFAETREKYSKPGKAEDVFDPLPFDKAIRIYAPKYRDCMSRILSSDFAASREWILDLCRCLKFKEEDVDRVLQNARQVKLDKDEIEMYCSDKRYVLMDEKSLSNKLLLCILFALYLRDTEDIPVANYMLDYFFETKEGDKCIESVGVTLRKKLLDLKKHPVSKKNPEELLFEYIEKQSNIVSKLEASIGDCYINAVEEELEKYYNIYKEEFDAYTKLQFKNKHVYADNLEVIQLHYLAALMYSVFSGREYTGILQDDTLEMMYEYFCTIGNEKECECIYAFIEVVMLTFLGQDELKSGKNGTYYTIEGPDDITEFNLDKIIINLIDAWILAIGI